VSPDVATAEELLREIATDLLRVQVDERARGLHLKALTLKRVVMSWSEQVPVEGSVEAMLFTLRALRIEVADLRSTSQVRIRSTFRGPVAAVPFQADLRRRAKG